MSERRIKKLSSGGGLGPKLALAFASAVFVVVVLEALMRLFYPQGDALGIHSFSPRLGHELTPNVDLVHVWDGHENVTRIRTNDLGLRSGTVPLPKSGDEFRVVLLGDSYTFGYGVAAAETFAAVLENDLNAANRGARRRVRVINAGVSSYGTTQEVLQYQDLGPTLDADLVILNFFVGNDLQDNLCLDYLSLEPHRRFPCFGVEGGRLIERSWPQAGQLAPARRSARLEKIRRFLGSLHLYRLVLERSRRLVASNPSMLRWLYGIGLQPHPGYLPHVVAGWYSPGRTDEGWSLTQGLIRRLHSTVAHDGAVLAVVIIPSRVQVLPALFEVSRILYPDVPEVEDFLRDPDRPQQLLAKFLAEEGIPALDLAPILRGHEPVRELYFPIIAHWNESGHRLVGTALGAFLKQEGLVPNSSSHLNRAGPPEG